MTITKTRRTVQLRVAYLHPDADDWPALEISYEDCWDDPDDDELPLIKTNKVLLNRYQPADTENPDADPVPTDVSGYEQDVQDIAAIIWAD